MAKQNVDSLRGVATFSGVVDQIRHVGDNDYGRSGDWIDVAVHGGIIPVPALDVVEEGDQIIVRGLLRNRGRVIDLDAQSILVCRSDEELTAWEHAFRASYRAKMEIAVSAYDKVSMVNKAINRFNAAFWGVGIHFTCNLTQEQYITLKPFDKQSLDFHFDLIRDFRLTGGEGNRNTVDTWLLQNPAVVANRKAPRATPTAQGVEK